MPAAPLRTRSTSPSGADERRDTLRRYLTLAARIHRRLISKKHTHEAGRLDDPVDRHAEEP